ncbi:DNA cytosine methyltransferase [Pseudophaeobacter sp. EL27]|uniref:DNA cytosine methyltransferase n=1 Tax=Pseudophaeobacter sp. EL27 TaxID=2107580 RepID=UPI000EFA33C2
MAAYYNEFDKRAAAWLRELIRAGLIAPGEVDERSILDVRADELSGFTQCHFFAGIGGWSYALRLAGWPDDKPAWTGSPPCQPLSVAGEGLGRDDPRHLSPKFASLVGTARPAVLFGEQVASAAVFGKIAAKAKRGHASAPEWAWWDDLSDRLESSHYAVGASDIPAAGVGAPHIRQRTFFGAYNLRSPTSGLVNDISTGLERHRGHVSNGHEPGWVTSEPNGSAGAAVPPCGLAISYCDRFTAPPVTGVHNAEHYTKPRGSAGGLADMQGAEREQPGPARQRRSGSPDGYNNVSHPDPLDGFWKNADWLGCRDGKWRPVEPGSFPLAHGLPGRVGLLRGYGNAICPWAAKEFIQAFEEAARSHLTKS